MMREILIPPADAVDNIGREIFGVLRWGGPPGLHGTPSSRLRLNNSASGKSARGPAADQGVRPTTDEGGTN